ncbi:MAG: cytoplasmic protein [Pyrinomonadaceae bacterium]
MDEFNPIIAAHKHCSNHRKELLASDVCGCFYCLEIYSPREILDWVDDDKIALCAKCGIDSVIGSTSNYSITKEFLTEMKKHWSDKTVSFAEVKKHFGNL